ncbi:glutaredoxin related protein [Cryptosporidium ubiquitum]|uniref:Glutaredoxin related protein n=1 Tax=Cryptosporidium ubiquitum TaxID=857276 RepID=A0A1J4MC72_9CRYT|nr:glutaredoxin related protein [Cryptosporidium ubiquitum]OII71826.1 glutaredoxin related protein [Cryptosporidium ubiquitum]
MAMNTVESLVESFINSGGICVISKSYCPYCIKVINSLKGAGYSPSILNIDGRADAEEIQNYCGKLTGGRTVPRVFASGKFIGGCDDTVKLLENGSLQNFVKGI